MKVWLVARTCFPEETCGEAASICVGKEGPNPAGLASAIESGHGSVLEHAVFTFRVEDLSRAALAQLTRHRIASFDVESQRYVPLNDPDFVIPESIENSEYAEQAKNVMRLAMQVYGWLMDAGVPCEDARYVTPQAVPTKLLVTMNARELHHFFALRCCNRAQWEIRELADKLLEICKEEAPSLFMKCGPGCVRERCPEKRPCGHPRAGEDLFMEDPDAS